MAQMFDAIDADGRRYVLAILRHEFDRVRRARRPALQLVDSGPAAVPVLAATAQRPVLAIVTQARKATTTGRRT
ncbi:hypothetical protein E7V67_006255 [[Empedobacter] haloabium]|uniref:Uncharacterized protein n=1 Tax=[Empedobacter] haloabium TaxID=592317 RepID=A0ABZ1UPX1_9BURK